jgi:hypothetical protein
LVGSKILDQYLVNQLLKLCDFSNDQNFLMLYQASEHGFSAHDFHSRCDNKAPTFTVIRSANGSIFGGYTEATWNHNGGYKMDKSAFIFSLRNKENTPIKMKISSDKQNQAIWCGSVYGPQFGYNDLNIEDNSNVNTDSYSNLGHCYQHPIFSVGSNEAKTFLAGSYKFQVSEIEVYQKV